MNNEQRNIPFSNRKKGGDLGNITSKVNELDAQMAQIATNVKSFGAVGDGVTDDTVAIQNALDNGDTVTFEYGKTYLIDGGTHLKILSASQKIIDLNFSTIKVKTNGLDSYRVFNIDASKNIVIRNGFLVGEKDTHTGTTGDAGHGVYLQNCENVLFENISFSNFWGDGIAATFNNKDVTIRKCKLDGNRRQGISVIGGVNYLIENCEFLNTGGTNPGAGIDIEPNPGQPTVDYVTIRDCIFKNNTKAIVVAVTVDQEHLSVTIDNCKCLTTLNDSNFIQVTGGGNIKTGSVIISNCTLVGSSFSVANVPNHFVDVIFLNNMTVNKLTAYPNSAGIGTAFALSTSSDIDIGKNIKVNGLKIVDDGLRGYTVYSGIYVNHSGTGIVSPINFRNIEIDTNIPVKLQSTIPDVKGIFELLTFREPTSTYKLSKNNTSTKISNAKTTLNTGFQISDCSLLNIPVEIHVEANFYAIIEPATTDYKLVGLVDGTKTKIRSSTVGSVLRIKRINATDWMILSKEGVWEEIV